jgi:hypothetical protein
MAKLVAELGFSTKCGQISLILFLDINQFYEKPIFPNKSFVSYLLGKINFVWLSNNSMERNKK